MPRPKKDEDPRIRFSQIAVGQWMSEDGRLQHSVYGVTKDGLVMVYRRRKQSWIHLEED